MAKARNLPIWSEGVLTDWKGDIGIDPSLVPALFENCRAFATLNEKGFRPVYDALKGLYGKYGDLGGAILITPAVYLTPRDSMLISPDEYPKLMELSQKTDILCYAILDGKKQVKKEASVNGSRGHKELAAVFASALGCRVKFGGVITEDMLDGAIKTGRQLADLSGRYPAVYAKIPFVRNQRLNDKIRKYIALTGFD